MIDSETGAVPMRIQWRRNSHRSMVNDKACAELARLTATLNASP
ncbi:MAG: hypothetical protein ABIS86_00840 [Streptosporangiaceae bacterium]